MRCRDRLFLVALGLLTLWGPGPAAARADARSLPVAATFDQQGRLWRAVADGQFVYVDHSDDLGATFSAPVAVDSTARDIANAGENRVAIGVDGQGVVSVLYPVRAGVARVGHYRRSTDGGKTFAPVAGAGDAINAGESRAGLNALLLTPTGRAVQLWYGQGEGDHAASLYAALLPTAGEPAVVHKLADQLCECCAPAVAVAGDGEVVIAARFVLPGNVRDHGLLRWSPSAAARPPAAPVRVTFDQWQINVCPTQGPSLSIGADGRHHLAWFTLGANKGLYYAHSDDGGARFSAPMAFGDAGALAVNARVLAQGERVVLAWQEYRGGRIRIRSQQSLDRGEHWSPPRELASTRGSADLPALLAGPDGMFLSWNTRDEGYRLVAIPIAKRAR